MEACPQCQKELSYGVSQSEKNPNRPFFKCDAKKGGCDYFVWEDMWGQPAKPYQPKQQYPPRGGRGGYQAPRQQYPRAPPIVVPIKRSFGQMQNDVPELMEEPDAQENRQQQSEFEKHQQFSLQMLHERLDRESSDFAAALRDIKAEYGLFREKLDQLLALQQQLIGPKH